MESFDKKMQDKFRDYDENIPAEYSWEKLGPGIVENIQTPKRNTRKILILLPFLVAFLGLGIYGISNINSAKEQQEQATHHNSLHASSNLTNTSTETTTDNKAISTTTNSNQSTKNETISSTKVNELSKQDKSTKNIKNSPVKPKENRSYISENLTKSKVNTEVNSSSTLGTETKIIPHPESIKTQRNGASTLTEKKQLEDNSLTLDSSKKTTNRLNSSSINTAMENNFSAFGRKPINYGKLTDLPILSFENPMAEYAVNVEKIDADETNNKFQAKHYLYAKSQTSFWTYGSDAFELSTFETPLLSWNSSLVYGYQFNKNWSLSAGLSYGLYRSRLSHIFTEIEQEYKADATQLVVNIITQESYTVEGAIEETRRKRKIVHHNTIESIGLPVHVSYLMDLHPKIELGVMAGIKANLLTRRTGRSIDVDESMIEYSKLAKPSLFMAQGIMGIQAAYKFNESFALSLEGSYLPALNSVQWLENDQRRISEFNLGLSLRYSL